MAIDHDRLFKELLSTFFQEFLELFVPGALWQGRPESIVFVDTETLRDVPGHERRRADLIAEVRYPNKTESLYLVHVEVQSQRVPDFGRRMFNYFSRIYEKTNRPVYPVALFAHDHSRDPDPATHTLAFPDLEVLTFRFATIQLKQLDWKEYLRYHSPLTVALMTKMGYSRTERPRVKAECIRILSGLNLDRAKISLVGTFIDTYLPLDKGEEIEYNRAMEGWPVEDRERVHEFMPSWERRGHERGLEQGLERGRAEGHNAGQIDILLTLLNDRFGVAPSKEDREILARVPGDALKKLATIVLRADSYEEWRADLTQVAQQTH